MEASITADSPGGAVKVIPPEEVVAVTSGAFGASWAQSMWIEPSEVRYSARAGGDVPAANAPIAGVGGEAVGPDVRQRDAAVVRVHIERCRFEPRARDASVGGPELGVALDGLGLDAAIRGPRIEVAGDVL